MYRLMKSEKHTLDHMACGPMSAYLHIQLDQFPLLDSALSACDDANNKAGPCHYVLNETGAEYYQGIWIS